MVIGLLGMPVFPILAQQADSTGTTTLVWEDHFADGVPVTPFTVNGITVSVSTSDPFGIGRPGNFTVEWDSRGQHAGYWKGDLDATARGQWVTFGLHFAPAVRRLGFIILDLDHNEVFHDSLEVVGWQGTTPVGPTVLSIGNASPPPIFFPPGTFSGRGHVDDSLPDGNITVRFDQPVDSVTFIYAAGPLTEPDPSRQTIGLSDLAWESEADLHVRAVAASSVLAADTLEMVVVVRNDGPAEAVSVVVSDTIGGAATIFAISDGGALLGGAVAWPLVESLAAGDSLVRTLSVLAPPTGTVSGVAAATAATLDPDPADNDGSLPEARVTTVVIERADLVVRATGPPTVPAGSPFGYTIVVRNGGPSGASGVVVTHTLPLAATFLSASNGGAVAGGVVTWPTVGLLPAGDSLVYSVSVQAPPTGSLLAAAAATAATLDQASGNNDGSAPESQVATTVLERADLVVTKSGPAVVAIGSAVAYRVVVRNAGPSVAEAVSLTDSLPAATTFAGASDGGTMAGGVVTWPLIPTLAAGDSVVRSVDLIAPANDTLVNVAAVVASTVDPVPANNDGTDPSARVVTAVVEVADVAVSVTGPATASVGGTLRYQVTVRNQGPGTAAEVLVTDTLPVGVSFLAASDGGSASGGVIEWPTIVTLPVGDSVVWTVDGIAPSTGLLRNVAAATTLTVDPDPTNNDGSSPGSWIETRLDLALSVGRRTATDTVTAGSVGVWADSVEVILGGTDADTASWSARSVAPWLALVDSAGTGTGMVRWRADLGPLRQGEYADTVWVTATAGGTGDSVAVTLVVVAPAVALLDAVDHLLGVQRLSDVQRRYLDQEGNADGVYNLGDLLAMLDRTGTGVTAEVMARLIAADTARAHETETPPGRPQKE